MLISTFGLATMEYEIPKRQFSPEQRELMSSLGHFLGRCTQYGGTGIRPDSGDWAVLVVEYQNYIPPWYGRLLLDFPVCKRVLGFQIETPEDFHDGIVWMRWADPMTMLDVFHAHIATIHLHGIFPVATGLSDNPRHLFFCRNDGSKNPPMLLWKKWWHQPDEEAELVPVVDRLSLLFKRAVFYPLTDTKSCVRV